MANTASIPLVALLATAGFVAAGFAAQASSLDQRIEGFVSAPSSGPVDVPSAVGQVDNGSVAHVLLTLEPAGLPVDVSAIEVHDDEDGRLEVHELRPLRDEDGSLGEGVLDGGDLARLHVEFAAPVDGGEEVGLVLRHGDPPSATELRLATPAVLEGDYARLDVDQR